MEPIETPQAEPIVSEVVAIEQEAPAEAEAVAVAEVRERRSQSADKSKRHVVSGEDKDNVYLGMCIYKNKYARKSLSVHHLQRRLTELGYAAAASDNDGWYGDETADAVSAFRKECWLPESDVMDMETLVAIFDGDLNIVIADKY